MRWFTRQTGIVIRNSESLRTAYRAAAKRLHPDRGGDAASFQTLQAAYEMLRRIYH